MCDSGEYVEGFLAINLDFHGDNGFTVSIRKNTAGRQALIIVEFATAFPPVERFACSCVFHLRGSIAQVQAIQTTDSYQSLGLIVHPSGAA